MEGSATFDFCVVGAGRMGASIAGQLALQGARVALFDRSDFDRKKGYEIMRADMKMLEERELILPLDKNSALERITLVENHEQCVQASIVVEAIFEELEAKRSLFAGLVRASANFVCAMGECVPAGYLCPVVKRKAKNSL